MNKMQFEEFEERERIFLEELTQLSRKHSLKLEGCSGLWFHVHNMKPDDSGWRVPYSVDPDGCIDFWEKPPQKE